MPGRLCDIPPVQPRNSPMTGPEPERSDTSENGPRERAVFLFAKQQFRC